ncbi:hypothetical protein ATK86_5623 [Nocardia fluminea]|uniref:Uncharacterized protein n=1 Tax=Nocardia fluminea TaxID=134984 RepID=A0A2N3VHQ9_9NOCA|nr:hypothetical protein ATK86_5623 [Nocardia fluminea]
MVAVRISPYNAKDARGTSCRFRTRNNCSECGHHRRCTDLGVLLHEPGPLCSTTAIRRGSDQLHGCACPCSHRDRLFLGWAESRRGKDQPHRDPDLGQRSKGVRCASIFTRFDIWVPFDETALHPTSRHLFVSFTVVLADSTVADPVRHTKRLFDKRRPPTGINVTGIGDSDYAVTDSSRYPGGNTGTIAASVEVRFRTQQSHRQRRCRRHQRPRHQRPRAPADGPGR